MSKKPDFFAVRRNVQLEEELNIERAAVTARDAVIAELVAERKAAPAPPPVTAAPAPVVDPLAQAKADYQALKRENPYLAAQFILNHGAEVARP